MAEKKTHIEIHAPVLEMADAIELGSMVKVDSNILREVTDGDDDPRFVIVDLTEQKSGNNINYDYDAFKLIADQVNEKLPNAYLGHVKDQEKDTAFPIPQAIWLGATVVKQSDGKAHLIAKAYLTPSPEGQARGLIKRRMINSVSWAGDAILTPAREGGYKLKEYFLESIDFSRKNRSGLKGQGLVLVTEELNDNDKGGGNKVADEQTYEEVVGKLTFHDLKTHNNALVTTIREMVKDEIKDETKTAVDAKEEELTTKHKAELEAVPEISLMQKIRDLLGIKDDVDPVASLEALLMQLDDLGKKAVRAWFDKEILEKKIPNEKARKLVGRLIPVTEMEGDWRTEKGLEKIQVALEEKADDILENDEDIKVMLTEMGSKRGGLRLSEMEGRRDRNHSDKNDGDSEADDVASRSGGRLKVEKIKVG